MTQVDQDLFQRAAAGDRDAFWTLILPYRGLIYSVALGILHNHERAEDQLHDVLIHAYRTLSHLRSPEKLASWLYTITRHQVLDALRRDTRQRGVMAEALRHGEATVPAPAVPGEETPIQRLEIALKQLPEPFRVVLAMKYVNNYPYQDIANILEMPLSTVKSRLFEARKLLRGIMEDDDAAGPQAGPGTPKGGGRDGTR